MSRVLPSQSQEPGARSQELQRSELRTVDWADGGVRLIDQTRLPYELVVEELTTVAAVADAIRTMKVRGAPAIGVTAALGMAVAAREAAKATSSRVEFLGRLREAAELLRRTRPTAVNLFWAIDRMLQVAEEAPEAAPAALAARVEAAARAMIEADVAVNRALGRHGGALLPERASVLTHCNAGALACVGYGTALGVIRGAVEAGKAIHVYVDETRPRLQGMKLTAWELVRDGIPATLITDNMAGWLMRQGKIDAVVVGADRIAANGDTANKIGTYATAVMARAHGLPFYVAAPTSTIDLTLADGGAIPIEERAVEEVTHVSSGEETVRLAPEGIAVYNPAFDVTPAELITAIITERGVAQPPNRETVRRVMSDE
jgi:methylthioribose-1-phosphate isomerase